MPPNLETPPQDLIVGIGELKESKNPQGVIVTYALGSCIGVTCYDPFSRVGGMLHAMLGDSKAGHQGTLARATYLDTGVLDLIQRVSDLGGNPRVFEFKIFGVPISIGADAHNLAGLRNIHFGVGIARKGWLGKKDVLNARPLGGVLQYLAKQ